MAQMSVYEDNSFDELWTMNFGGFCEEALNEAAGILEEKMKANAKSTILHEGESEMVDSIKASKPKKSKNGAYIVNVGPRGYSSTKVYHAKDGHGVRTSRVYSVSNALKAIWKEYGIPSRGIPAQPFISPATSQTESQIYELIQKKFEEAAQL